MSHYVECKPGFKDREALIEALVAVGFDRSQIEVHQDAVVLYGYRGDEAQGGQLARRHGLPRARAAGRVLPPPRGRRRGTVPGRDGCGG